MNITFVHRGCESLGVEYLSAILKGAGHNVDLAFDPLYYDSPFLLSKKDSGLSAWICKKMGAEEHLYEDITLTKPDMVAFSVTTMDYHWARGVAERVKELLDVPIVFGGIHPSSVPERVLGDDFIDFVVVGEGEYALLDLANCLESDTSVDGIKNLCFRGNNGLVLNPLRPLISDLDELPFPDKGLFEEYIPMSTMYNIMPSKGCPFNCVYCAHHLMRRLYKNNGNYVRRRSLDNVIGELRIAKRRYNPKEVFFSDDVFTVDKEWIKSFLPRYKAEIGIPFTCLSHIKFLDDEVISLLKETGCIRFEIGVQTGIEKNRRAILHRMESDQDIRRVADSCRKTGLPHTIDHIFGIFSETEEDQIKSAKFYLELKPSRILCYMLSYFPQLDITKMAHKKGYLDEGKVDLIETGSVNSACLLTSNPEKDVRLFNNFRKFYSLMPLLPARINEFVLDHKLYRSFYLIPHPVAVLFGFVGTKIRGGSKGQFFYDFEYYLLHLKKLLHRSIRRLIK